MADPLPGAPPPDGGRTPSAAPERLLTPAFGLTWLATFALFVSYYMLLPTLPLYALQLGSSEGEVGFVLGIFTAASMFVRPCVAPAIDRRGRKPFIVAGAVVFVISGALYFFATSLPRLLLLRAFHGLGMGIFMTAATALVTDVVPIPRRGEALGAYGLAIHVGMAFAPAAGMAVVNRASFVALFLLAGLMAVVALALGMAVPARAALEPGAGASARARTPAGGPLLSRAALFPSVIMVAQTIPYGAALSFVPIWGRAQGLENPGTFFTFFALAMLAVRTQTGKLSDRFGRGVVIVPGLGIVSASMVLLAFAHQPWQLQASGIVLGLGMGAVQPALGAFLTDRVPETERARAFAVFYGAFELGIAVGSIGLGWFLEATGFPAMWLAGAAVAGAGMLMYLAGARATVQGGPLRGGAALR